MKYSEPSLREHHRDKKKCPFNGGDNYKDYMSIFVGQNQEMCPLNRGDNYKDYMSVFLFSWRSVPLIELSL